MSEVYPNLYVGNGDDGNATIGKEGWFVLSAAKEPWHRKALGYETRGAPKEHPDYFAVDRGKHWILNLIDAADVAYIPEEVMKAAMRAIIYFLPEHKVLVHCNQGQSRSPTIAMLYLQRFDPRFTGLSYDDAVAKFKTIYPPYAPSKGMADYARQHWSDTEVAA